MQDTTCPYCNEWQEINHDDGYGYEEGKVFNQECTECGKIFVYTTGTLFIYDAKRADCLYEAEHDYKLTSTYPKAYSRMQCSICSDERNPTEEEREKYKLDE